MHSFCMPHSAFCIEAMAFRVAAVTSFVVFAVCLVAGADNPFGTAVGRALVAMGATLGVGLIVGWMGQKMIEENVTQQQAKAVADATEVLAESTVRADNKASDNRSAKSAGKKDAGKTAPRGR